MSRPYQLNDSIGVTFGRLTVLSCDGTNKHGLKLWRCLCECGTITTKSAASVKSGNTQSCGCLNLHGHVKHGQCRRDRRPPTEYNSWMNMRRRCSDPKNEYYTIYGGRGITVCERWQNSFQNFLDDMGLKPSPQHSLDRYPNKDGNYEPGNVRWATQAEQLRNTRDTVMLTLQGKTMCMKDWAIHSGISKDKLRYRLKVKGLTLEQALTYF